jgi:hypothetical protein
MHCTTISPKPLSGCPLVDIWPLSPFAAANNMAMRRRTSQLRDPTVHCAAAAVPHRDCAVACTGARIVASPLAAPPTLNAPNGCHVASHHDINLFGLMSRHPSMPLQSPIAAIPPSIVLLLPLPIPISLPSLTPFTLTSGRHRPSLPFMVIVALHSAIVPPSCRPLHRRHRCPLRLCCRHCHLPPCCLLSAIPHCHRNRAAIPPSIALSVSLPIAIVLPPLPSLVATAPVHGNCHNCAAFPQSLAPPPLSPIAIVPPFFRLPSQHLPSHIAATIAHHDCAAIPLSIALSLPLPIAIALPLCHLASPLDAPLPLNMPAGCHVRMVAVAKPLVAPPSLMAPAHYHVVS